MIQWEDRDKEDGHDLLDVLPAKAIVVDSDANLELLGEGDNCQALFNKKMYPATIVGSGKLWMHLPPPPHCELEYMYIRSVSHLVPVWVLGIIHSPIFLGSKNAKKFGIK